VGAIFSVAASQVNSGLVEFFHGVQVAIMLTLMLNIVQFAWWSVRKKNRKYSSHCAQYGSVYLLLLATCMVCLQPVCMLVIGSWSDMPNFFLDGGITGNACQSDADCPNDPNGCMTSAFDCGQGNPAGQMTHVAFDGSDPTATGACPDIPRWLLDSELPADATDEMKTWFDNWKSRDITSWLDVEAAKSGSTCAMDSNALYPNTTVGWCIQVFGTYCGFITMFIGVFWATKLHHKIAAKWRVLRNAATGR